MSEYQYYEFQAVDHRLTDEEMSELRTFSTRAAITPNSFVNEYSWGSFKGDEDRWMEKYFDGFLYYANWGTHILKLRLSSTFLDLKTVQLYCSDHFSARLSCDNIILDFLSENEDGEEWENDFRLSSFLSLRSDLSRGDLRCLYLGWLSSVQYDDCDEEELEPPVPPGLTNLNSALVHFAEFLCINPDLIAAASKKSPPLVEVGPNSNDFRKWLATLSINEKETFLADIFEGSVKNDRTPVMKLAHCFNKMWQSQQAGKKDKPKQRRTVAQLLEESECFTQIRRRLEAEQTAAEQAERQRLRQLEKEKRLNEIAGHESVLWDRIESLVSEKKSASYDKAVVLLIDLRDLAVRGNHRGFLSKLNDLRKRHSAKSSFIGRLRSMN